MEKSGQVFLSYHDVQMANPNWSMQMVEDYISLKRDLSEVADEADGLVTVINATPVSVLAQLNEINDRLGSGDALTSDDTGFTVDSINLTVDMIEA